jgi:arylsulfatase
MMDGIKQKKALVDGMDVDKVRAELNRIIQQQLQTPR